MLITDDQTVLDSFENTLSLQTKIKPNPMATPNLKAYRPLSNYLLVNVHKTTEKSPIIRPVGYIGSSKELVRATIVSRGTLVSREHKNRDVILIVEGVGKEKVVNGFTFHEIRETDIISTI